MSSPPYRRVAVIGAGPSGIAAARALHQEACFEAVSVFERKSSVGGMWLLEPDTEDFQPTEAAAETPLTPPPGLGVGKPAVRAPPVAPRRPGSVAASYAALDTNTGAGTMAFTHTPLPAVNSAASVRALGPRNSTRPRATVVQYLETVAEPVRQYIRFRTSIERVERVEEAGEGEGEKEAGEGEGEKEAGEGEGEKEAGEGEGGKKGGSRNGTWTLTLRQETDDGYDLWTQESFDAVIVASGHFNIGQIPRIDGLVETWSAAPGAFLHSKSFRNASDYAGQSVVVVGGNISAAELVEELHEVAGAPDRPLYISRRHPLGGLLSGCWKLPNVKQKPGIERIQLSTVSADRRQQQPKLCIHFSDGSTVDGVDKVIFATGFRRSFPYLPPGLGAVPTPGSNRLAGFFQHVFCTKQPSLAAIGTVDGAISLRVFEYQAVAVARLFAGRAAHSLPPADYQRAWEADRVARIGPSERFHEIFPDTGAYFGWLRKLAGEPHPDAVCSGRGAYALPPFQPDWPEIELEVLFAKAHYWNRINSTRKE